MGSGRSKSIVLTGAYGHGNIGDDLLGALTASELRRQGHDVLLATGSSAAGSSNISQSRRRLIRELGPSRLLLLGGGGLFNDAWATDYPRYFSSLATAARLRRSSAAAVGVGVEVPRTLTGHACLLLASRALRPFGVRDDASAGHLRRHGAGSSAFVSPDLGWLAANANGRFPRPDPAVVTVTIAGETDRAARRRLAFLEATLSELVKAGLVERSVGVAMQHVPNAREHDDVHLLELLARRTTCPMDVVVPGDAKEAQPLLASGAISIGYRLHGLLLAYLAGTPVVAVSRSPKVTAAFSGAPGAVMVSEPVANPEAALAATREATSFTNSQAKQRHIQQQALMARTALERVVATA